MLTAKGYKSSAVHTEAAQRVTKEGVNRVSKVMARQQLCDFIRKFDIRGADVSEDYWDNNPLRTINEFKDKVCDDVTFDELKKAFPVFLKKVAIKDFPGTCSQQDPECESGACTVAREMASFLTGLLSELVIEKDDPAFTAAAGELLLDAWMTLVKVGPHLTHVAIMDVMSDDSTPRMKQYIPVLDHVVTTTTTSPTPKKKQLASVRVEFLEVYFSFHSQLPRLPEDLADELKFLIMCIGDNFEEKNPYLHLTNVDIFKKHITLIKDMACSDATGENTAVTNMAARTLALIINALTADKNDVLDTVFDHLMKTISHISKHPRARQYGRRLFDIFDYKLFEVMRDSSKAPSDSMFESCQKMMTDVLSCGEVYHEMEHMIKKAQEGVVDKVKLDPASKAKSILQTVKGMLLSGKQDLISKAAHAIDNSRYKGTVFVWKNLVPDAIALIDAVGNQPVERMEDDKVGACKDLPWTINEYKSFIEKLLKFLSKARVIPQIQTALVACIFNCLESPSIERAEIADACTDEKFLDLSTVSEEIVTDILRRINKLLKNRDLPWENNYQMRTTQYVLSNVMTNYFEKRNVVTSEHTKLLLSIVKTCGEGDSIEDQLYQEGEPDRKSVHFLVYCDLISSLVRVHEKEKSRKLLAPIIPDLMKWASIAAKEKNEEVMQSIFSSIHAIVHTAPEILKDSLSTITQIFIKLDPCNDLLWGAVNTLYPLNPKAVHSHLKNLFGMLDTGVERTTYLIISLLYTISKKHPEVFTTDHITRLLKQCGKNAELSTSVLMIIQNVANVNAKIVAPEFPTFVDDTVFKPASFVVRAGVLASIGELNESSGQRAIDYLMKYASYRDQDTALAVLNAVRTLMPKHVDYMKKHRSKLEKTKQITTNPEIKDVCHQMILVIDGISIEDVFEDVKQQQEDISELDTKVDSTIGTVQTIGGRVVEHHKQIKGVKKNIAHIKERVDEAEDNIEETKNKMEEIDNKTMTNAPKWSRDLTKLMNPKTDTDWRLLASRLGYSNTDIRGWAQQNDPCMALLSEWYATHKTSDASHAVLTALQEMNRVDGAAIVENAMKTAEGVVEDEDFKYASPPPIFLSYQWGVQDEVRLLQRHLNMAGYECWMDIGQMGGGDKLFAKIDNGIRAAKVVICCTTDKYAQSPNCNREVNLSVNLGKPIIPLLMEKMAWPPKGSMGPIFSEYLFIRFFQRDDEETKDQRYWPIPKFQELLMQLNLYVVPDPKLIKKAYKDWWRPMIDDIVIDKNKAKGSSSKAQPKAQVDQKKQPMVFLSYQWGKQPQVKVLYQRLTGLGYTVWMDIYQMGGGDSLYDKIDRGMRGCNAVVTCVTPKYALSANCRREVSLADALKKPIIPLLLETMTWPPDGPMSMVFTQLLYINCYRDPDVQITWTGPSVNELCDKLQTYIPEIGPSTSNTHNVTRGTNKFIPVGTSAQKNVKGANKAATTAIMKSVSKTPGNTVVKNIPDSKKDTVAKNAAKTNTKAAPAVSKPNTKPTTTGNTDKEPTVATTFGKGVTVSEGRTNSSPQGNRAAEIRDAKTTHSQGKSPSKVKPINNMHTSQTDRVPKRSSDDDKSKPPANSKACTLM